MPYNSLPLSNEANFRILVLGMELSKLPVPFRSGKYTAKPSSSSVLISHGCAPSFASFSRRGSPLAGEKSPWSGDRRSNQSGHLRIHLWSGICAWGLCFALLERGRINFTLFAVKNSHVLKNVLMHRDVACIHTMFLLKARVDVIPSKAPPTSTNRWITNWCTSLAS